MVVQCPNWIAGREQPAHSGQTFSKISPVTGETLFEVARSGAADLEAAIAAAKTAQPIWAETPLVKRGEVLFSIADAMHAARNEIAETVALETGKSRADALGETAAAIALCRFYAGEGQRFFGRTTTSSVVGRTPIVIRQPVGIAGLIVAANTPIANVAWKVFPALICGNAALVKPSEDTPRTAWMLARICSQAFEHAGLPTGVIATLNGLGAEIGAALVQHADVGVVSFTGSTRVGKWVAVEAGKRLAKVSLELGGKNPLVVCDDADLDLAVKWALLSSFSNAGQRCASSSRLLVHEKVYDEFKKRLVAGTERLKVGPNNGDDLGPVINAKQLAQMQDALSEAKQGGARILCGGERLTSGALGKGFFLAPTVVENVPTTCRLHREEIFGPITALYKIKDLTDGIREANASAYGLTAAVHTRDVNQALRASMGIQTGTLNWNAGTHGSEPHMPFGGLKESGNGSREPGPEALDIYSNLKVVQLNYDPLTPTQK